MTHTAISGILLFSLVPAWIFGIIIIVYLARKKDFFINNFKNMANENKSTTWVVIQILIREAIIMIPLCIILLIAMGSIVASMDITKENMMQKLLANPELTDQIQGLYMLAGLILIIISYFGVWWGCKYVCKRTLIDSKDYIKIGYWVSLIPALVLFEINSYMAGAAFILGVILTPWVIKKWLVKLQNQFRGHN
jgi:uncharacterized protein YneF (UPF0154 family)